jgi:hypothetical protein
MRQYSRYAKDQGKKAMTGVSINMHEETMFMIR